MTNPKLIIGLGALTTFGALMGVAADILSAWSPSTNEMQSAFAVGLDNIVALYVEKPRWTFVLGNFFGVYFIPLHVIGFFLVFQALKPASPGLARVFLGLILYILPIGVGLHGTLAFVGDIIQSGDAGLIDRIRDYWQPWAYSLVLGYAVATVLIAALILTGRSLYARWMALVSPIGLVAVSALAIAALPDSAAGLKSVLALTGLNLPLVVFFPLTTWVLATRGAVAMSL